MLKYKIEIDIFLLLVFFHYCGAIGQADYTGYLSFSVKAGIG